MCVIVIKPKNIDINDKIDILRECDASNSDGMGYSYELNNKIYFNKGFFKVSDLIESINNIGVDNRELEIVIHFRFSTSGQINKGLCHPYILSRDYRECLKLKGEVNTVIHHNGVISDYEPEGNIINDSVEFITRFMCKVNLKDEDIQEGIEFLTNSKFVIHNTSERGGLIEIGLFMEYEGLRCSNLNFINSYTSYFKDYKDIEVCGFNEPPYQCLRDKCLNECDYLRVWGDDKCDCEYTYVYNYGEKIITMCDNCGKELNEVYKNCKKGKKNKCELGRENYLNCDLCDMRD